jgi:hypothetical protein
MCVWTLREDTFQCVDAIIRLLRPSYVDPQIPQRITAQTQLRSVSDKACIVFKPWIQAHSKSNTITLGMRAALVSPVILRGSYVCQGT